MDNLNFSFYSMKDQKLSVILFDAQGKQVLNQTIFASGNSENHYSLKELSTISSGIYFLRVNTESGNYFSYQLVKGE